MRTANLMLLPSRTPFICPSPPDTMAHPFVQLSPDEQREQLSCADAWPVLSISYNLDSKKLLLAARHHAGRADVCNIDPRVSVLSASTALWWWSFTSSSPRSRAYWRSIYRGFGCRTETCWSS